MNKTRQFTSETWTEEEKSDLLHKINQIKARLNINNKFEGGYCTVVCYGLWKSLGQPKDWRLYDCMMGEEGHTIMIQMGGTKKVIDPTFSQFSGDEFQMFTYLQDIKREHIYSDFEKIQPNDYQYIEEELQHALKRRNKI